MSKITLVISGLRGGGAERVCVTLANGLARRGYDIDVVVLSLAGAIRDKDLSSQVNLISLEVGHARYSMFRLWRYLRSAHPQTVLSFNRQISVVLGVLRKYTWLRFRLVSRNITFLSVSESVKTGFWRGLISITLTKKFYRLSDLLIAQCHAMKEDLVNYLGVPDDKVAVIYNPVGDWGLSLSGDYGCVCRSETKGYLLCVGHLEPVKAFHYAIKAFGMISLAYPDLRLKILGTGSLECQLKEQVCSLGLSDRVDFEGYQSDIGPYYVGASVTMLTSHYEGFPNVLSESIALGTPVLSFDCPSGPREIVVDGVNGFLVKQYDVKGLARRIDDCLSANWDKETIIETSRKFNSERIIEEYERVL